MTPGIEAAKRAGIDYRVHQYAHESSSESYGMEAAEKLSVAPEQVFKTLVARLDGSTLVVAIVPVNTRLNLKQLAKVLGGKKAVMAEPGDVERTTGYVLGGVSPLGQKKVLSTVLDASAQTWERILVSAGRRGLEIELSPQDLITLTRGRWGAISQSDRSENS